MFRKPTWKREEEKLLDNILKLQTKWTRINKIINQSIEPSETGQIDLNVAKVKYFYLLREAKHYKLNAPN